jgi:ribosome-associated protein
LRAKPTPRPLAPKALAQRIARLSLEKKGEQVLILDLRELSAACDYFVLCTARSEQQVLAIAEHIAGKMRERGQPPWHVEGRSHRRWVLIDFVDVVGHVFHHETRDYYMLERLWGDAKVTEVKDRRPARKESA